MSICLRVLGVAVVSMMQVAWAVPLSNRSDDAKPPAVKNVVLVHGAWADGSSWRKVIPLLQAKGLHVVCVQNPLTSFADDVAATKRIVDAQDGPVILVGHSYGGAVITEAGNDPKVAALVYVAAFAPDQGQSAASQGKPYGQTPGVSELRPLEDGFLVLSPKGIREDFASDLPNKEKELLLATQVPTQAAALEGKVSIAAWHNKPSWFVVALNDRMIAPKQQRDEAEAMHSTVMPVASSHVPQLAHPERVANAIRTAAFGGDPLNLHGVRH